ncbi:MAG: hypothetical protein ACE5LX_10220, partial [Nitrospinota bacterium]
MKHILWLTSSFGLGHAYRDVGIARALRRLVQAEVVWLAGSPVREVLEAYAERVHPASLSLQSSSRVLESAARRSELDLGKVFWRYRRDLRHNLMVIQEAARGEPFDLWVADECWEVLFGLETGRNGGPPLIFITDFLRFESVGWNPFYRLLAYWLNRAFIRQCDGRGAVDALIFLGEAEDVPEGSFGPGLPQVSNWAAANCHFTGPAFAFSPADLPPSSVLRRELGYPEEKRLIIASIGGTAAGKELLESCARAYEPLCQELGPVEMVLVGGPRISPTALPGRDGIRAVGYLHELYRHFAASDAAIVQGGWASTLELAALRKPFLYFPLIQHFEQERHIP